MKALRTAVSVIMRSRPGRCSPSSGADVVKSRAASTAHASTEESRARVQGHRRKEGRRSRLVAKLKDGKGHPEDRGLRRRSSRRRSDTCSRRIGASHGGTCPAAASGRVCSRPARAIFGFFTLLIGRHRGGRGWTADLRLRAARHQHQRVLQQLPRETTRRRSGAKSKHHSNPVGFVAGCSDCHCRASSVPKMVRRSGREGGLGHFTGSINTPEKYEAHRKEMPRTSGARMKSQWRPGVPQLPQPALSTDQGKAEMHKGACRAGRSASTATRRRAQGPS